MSELKKWYNETYLRSSHWQDLRRRAFEKYGRKCSVVDCTIKKLNIHHISYEYLGEVREINDVRPVCWIHHKLCHWHLWGLKKVPLNRENLTRRYVEIKRFHWRHLRFSDIFRL